MIKPIKHIVIVGGGSAGWITAGLLAAEHQTHLPNAIKITLVESPDVASIGVGEGTWPSMRNTLDKIGINEFDFIRYCNASFKQGSQFNQWNTTDVEDSYYHPFMTPEGYVATNLHAYWQQHSQLSFADTVNVQSHICKTKQAPKQTSTPQYAGVTNYGYHLDAGKFADMLQKHCTNKLAVNHIKAHLTSIISAKNGDIEAIVTDQATINGDLFVDCTGAKALLLGEHLGIKSQPVDHILFNDSALAVQVPHQRINDDIHSTTLSTAQSAGWIWDIALSTRRGIGYTFSSQYTDDQQANHCLLEYLKTITTTEIAESLTPRKITFTPGYREKFWQNNCVAIGMSSGFIEPLEASALAMVELSATMLAEELPVNTEHMKLVANRFNQRFTYRWQRVIDFVKLHYVLSKREDSAYWRDNKQLRSIPEQLQNLLQLWQYQPPSRHDLVQNEEVFPSASYQYILYGMGFDTQQRSLNRRFDNAELSHRYIDNNRQLVAKYTAGLPTNRELLNFINGVN